MKIINLIIGFFLLYAFEIEKVEFDLTDGKELLVEKTNILKEYIFYIKTNGHKLIGIYITIPYDFFSPTDNFPLLLINIKECSSRNDLFPITSWTMNVNFVKRNYVFESSIFIEVSSSYTNYISFDFVYTSLTYTTRLKCDVLDGLYNLNNGISTNIAKLKSKETYYFYSDVLGRQEVKFNLAINYMNSTPFSNINIYEYESKYSSYKKSQSNSISFKSKDNQLISEFSYIPSLNSIKHLSFRITPSYDINNLIIKFEFPIEIIDLNSNTQTINNLTPGKIYLFYIKVKPYSKVDISLNINKISNNIPFNNIYIYEYEKKDIYASYHSSELKNITTSIKENEFTSSFSHNIDFNITNYMAFSIKPLFNIDYLISKYNIAGGSYELLNGTQLNITKLISNNDYYLLTLAAQFQTAIISLTTNYMDNTPLSYVYINEIDIRNANKNNKYNYRAINMTNENNALITSFTYLLNESISSNYISIKITPTYDIDFMTAKIDIINSKIYLSYRSEEKIYNLKSGIKYYIIILNREEVNLNLIMNKMKNYPFSQVTVYESTKAFPSPEMKRVIIDNLEFKKKNNEMQVSIKVKSLFYSHVNIYVEIKPIYDIEYLIAKDYVEGYSSSSNDSEKKKLTIAFLIILFLIVIIICIINKIRKYKDKVQNDISQMQPLHPNNDDI